MALRDYLNFTSTADFADFTLQNGQAVAIVTMDGTTPLETWYYNASSMAVPNDSTVFKPNAVAITSPGRYIKNMTASDWTTTLNKPIFADVAVSGDYNDLENKITAGIGILMDNNEISVDDSQFMSKAEANTAIAEMQAEIAGKVPEPRTITINGITQDLEANRDWEVGNLSSSGSYSNPTWLVNLAVTKITGLSAVATSNSYEDLSNKPNLSLYYLASNPNGYITAVPAQTFASITGKPATLLGYGITDGYPLTGNPSNFLTSVPAQSWNSITGKPVFATVATSASYNDLTNTPVIPAAQVNANWNAASGVSQVLNKPTALSAFTNDAVLTNTQITTALGFSPYNSTNPNGYLTQAGARSSISLTTSGTTGNASYDSSTGVLNVPNYALSRSFNNAAVKTINGAGVRISTTRDTFVTYTITHTIALTLLLASGSSQVYLEISTDNVNWSTISQAGYSDGVAVAVALTKTTTNNIQGFVPANSYVRLRSIVSGGGSSAFTNGQEVLQ